MSNVVDLNPDNMIWICECDSASFHLCKDGEAECCVCGGIANADGQGWYDRVADAPRRDPDLPEPVIDINGNDSVEFARRRVSKMATNPDASLVIVVDNDGALHTWSEVETEEQEKWATENVNKALDLIVGLSQKIRLKGQDT